MEGTKANGKRKKAFPQYSWNSSKGIWASGTQHAIRVPYRSDEIMKYANSMRENSQAWTLVFLEGEKDVANGIEWLSDQMDFQFTTVCQGAKKGSGDSIWEDTHQRYLEEFDPQSVIVIGDRDEAGINYMEVICAKIHAAGYPVQGFLVHESLGDDGADLSDHIAAGFTYEDLVIADWKPPQVEPATTLQDWPTNTGIASEQYRYMAEQLREDVMYIPGTEEPWHVRQPGTALFEPNNYGVIQIALDIMEARYDAAQDAGNAITRAAINRLRGHCTLPAVKNALEASISQLTVTLDDVAEHAHPHLINCGNEIIDLRYSSVVSGDHDYRFTKATKVEFNPNAKCPKFLKMLSELQPDPVVRDWLHRVSGNGVTGDLEALILIFWGRGADGKSTFANVIQHVLGDYAVSSKSETWLRSRAGSSGERPRPDKFRLRGARTIFTSETPFDGMLDEVAVKGFVGGDEIVERTLHRKVLPFRGQGLLIFITNNHMRIMDSSLGMRRRMRQIPWHANIPLEKQIPHLDRQIIEEESEGILVWLIEGAREYYNRGVLDTPPAINVATESYLENEDDLADFLSQVIDQSDSEAIVDRATLYSAFKEWADKAGLAVSAWSQSKLTRELTRRGLVGCRHNNTRCWLGVKLRRL